MRRFLLLALASAAAAACGGRDPTYEAPIAALGPASAGGLLFWATSDKRLVTVDPSVTRARWAPLAGVPTQLATAGDDALVLSTGSWALERAHASGGVDLLPLPSPYDRVDASPDGRYALCTYGLDPHGAGARNLNEVGVVDLAQNLVRKVVLNTASLAPRAVVFSPRDATPRYAAVLLTSGVAVVDLDEPQSREVRIDLSLSGGTLAPKSAVFAPDARHLFLVADGSDDVFAVSLFDNPDGSLGGRVNFLAGGRGPQALLTLPEAPNAVAVVFSSGDAALLDADGRSDAEQHLKLPGPASALARLPGLESGLLPTALAWGGGSSVFLWDLAAQTISAVNLGASYDAQGVVEGGFALFAHHAMPFPEGATPALTDLSITRSSSGQLKARPRAIQLASALSGSALDAATGAYFFSIDGESSLWRLPVASALPEEVKLDAPAVHVGVAGDYAWADSGDPLGDLTFVPAARFDRAAASRLQGFLLTGAADRAEKGK